MQHPLERMRLLVNCSNGSCYSLQYPEDTKVSLIKENLYQLEGVPPAQQQLLHAGRVLKDHLELADYQLSDYSLSDEVVLHMKRLLAKPKRIYLAGPSNLQQTAKLEVVEATASIQDVMQLLLQLQMVTSFRPDCPLILRREDDTTMQLEVLASDSLDSVEEKVEQREGMRPKHLTFQQAQDGALHITTSGIVGPTSSTYPVYKRKTLPEQFMFRKTLVDGQPLPEVVKELCIIR